MNRSITDDLASGASTLDLELEAAITRHDQAAREYAAATGTAIWLGAEPTFTDRFSEAPEWLSEALGEDKERRARQLLTRLLEAHPGAVALRPIGRQYTKEPEPRWCYGLYLLRDGQPVWQGPPDRLQDGAPHPTTSAQLSHFRSSLVTALRTRGWAAEAVTGSDKTDDGCDKFVCRREGKLGCVDSKQDERLGRGTIHEGRIEGAGLVDELSTEGTLLVLLHAGAGGDANTFWVELPAFPDVASFLEFLEVLGHTCQELAVEALGLRGFPPPVDASVAWTTLTPDPAVLEVNQAPEPDMAAFHRANRLLFELAQEIGLSPYRLQYNGAVSDSGGGGQLTIGGPSPQASPFFTVPQLLPRLIRYVIRHPSLSYWFATQYVGSSSQSPRPDEGLRESFLELEVALDHLGRLEHISPELLWGTLRHFLADASGNPHRSELNIEKLDNPFLPGRGRQGLVEFRALSMAKDLRLASARALLFRGIVVMLTRHDTVSELVDWRDELHDRFALPYYLALDLREVFADLQAAGLGLTSAIEAMLLDRGDSVLGVTDFEGCRLQLEQALEFWPLVGDVASQESGSSRLVDASTSRLQVLLSAEGPDAEAKLDALEVSVNGHLLPLGQSPMAEPGRRVVGLRYRSFVPWNGLHPALGAESGLHIGLRHTSGRSLSVKLHPWRPSDEAYPGLPVDLEDAAARRLERAVESTEAQAKTALTRPPVGAVTPYCLDLRRLTAGGAHHPT